MLTIAEQLVEEGFAKGKLEGKLEGIEEEREKVIHTLIALGYSYDEIVKQFGYAREDVLKVCEKLEEIEEL